MIVVSHTKGWKQRRLVEKLELGDCKWCAKAVTCTARIGLLVLLDEMKVDTKTGGVFEFGCGCGEYVALDKVTR